MGYLRKGMVINALREDMQDTKMCYEGCAEKEIVEFCYNCAEHAIDRLPQYFPENVAEESRWIPVSERMPELDTPVLAQWRRYYSDENNIDILYLNGLGEWYADLGMPNGKIIAWMPLPEPYKEGEDE